ncbi:MAG TPA: hypothetical protein VF702_05300 [Allosphingosinicella sp.]|jgi:hypothetical protein
MNKWLIAGGCLSAAAALLHVAVMVGGPDWYRFVGAGEEMASAAARGSIRPALITSGIASLLLVWAAYAWSGAGLLPRLPLLRTALVLISAVYLLRAVAPVPILLMGLEPFTPFLFWSSLIVLVYGLAHAIGTWQIRHARPR